MENYNDIDEKILSSAKTLFEIQGLVKTQMKDIAQKSNIGRSTLYRHFDSKESILFVIANRSLIRIMNYSQLPDSIKFVDGYEAVCWQSRSLIKGMLEHEDDIVFLRDFDYLFTNDFPVNSEVNKYEQYIQNTEGMKDMETSFYRGIADGSIYQFENPRLILLTLINGCFAMAQRILPREKRYIIELGYGREILNRYLELFLSTIKKDSDN